MPLKKNPRPQLRGRGFFIHTFFSMLYFMVFSVRYFTIFSALLPCFLMKTP